MSAKSGGRVGPEFANFVDALANGVTSGFDPARGIHVDLGSLQWKILPAALDMGRKMEAGRTSSQSTQTDTAQAGRKIACHRSVVR